MMLQGQGFPPSELLVPDEEDRTSRRRRARQDACDDAGSGRQQVRMDFPRQPRLEIKTADGTVMTKISRDEVDHL